MKYNKECYQEGHLKSTSLTVTPESKWTCLQSCRKIWKNRKTRLNLTLYQALSGPTKSLGT